jgi:hypothetical protein
MARTVERKFFGKKYLGASFFFSQGGGVSHAGKLVVSIAVQLASSIPTLHRYISNAIIERSEIIGYSLWDQWHQLTLRPQSNVRVLSFLQKSLRSLIRRQFFPGARSRLEPSGTCFV